MKKVLIAVAVAAALAASLPALARGPGVAAGVNAGVGLGAGVNAGGHGPSAAGMANANGGFAAERQFGLDRAQERMSEQGRVRQRATTAPDKGPRPAPETPPAGVSAEGGATIGAGATSR